MAKYYVKCGRNIRVLSEVTSLAAAIRCVSTWKLAKRKLEIAIRVSEVGFDATSDHPHHVADTIFPTSLVKAKLDK